MESFGSINSQFTLPQGGTVVVLPICQGADPSLSPACLDRFYTLSTPARQQSFLAARHALYCAMSTCNALSSLEKLTYSPEGKPQLPPGEGYVSLSHSATHAAAVFHPSRPVGIDIEGPRAQLERIAQKFCTPQEINGPLRHIWGAKEAMYKAAGWPGVGFASEMSVSLNKAQGTIRQVTADLWHREIDDQWLVCALLPTEE